ncbi:MAG TPA: MBL fold metallo-hydrolase [Vicinamibacterales bacterium]|nr:MBL fold metallo-hydrolase [Vicinamibacterales bacterium]
MRTLTILALVSVLTVACGPQAGTLPAAESALGVAQVNSIEFSGKGRWYQFGQAPAPNLPWPQFDVSNYTATVNYAAPAARVQMSRIQTVEQGRVRPAPVEQRPDQYVSGTTAWNLAVPGGAPANTPPVAQPQPAAVEERVMEIWTTPHGFLKAAAANNATSAPATGGTEVTFTVGGRNKYVGIINGQNEVATVRTWIDNPVLGDTEVEFTYSDYQDFGGVRFPARILRVQGGHPVLDLTVSGVKANPAADMPVPAEANAAVPPVMVTAEKLASGVYYIKGGSHHSVAIDQKDHIVLVEGPQTEARSLAVIAKVKETIPNKPIKYLINTHVHFDHSGGVRTYVDEGAAIVTHEANKPYYEQAWAAPHTINPDRLAQSKKTATFETFTDKKVLTDGSRSIEIHQIAGGGHNDAFAMIYLPKEKILIEGDAFTPLAANAPAPAVPNPYSVNLNDNIERLKLDVKQIAALHGPRLTTMADLKAFIGQGTARGTN